METPVMTEEFGMEEALAQSSQAKPGTVVEGTVVSQSDKNLLVDVGFKQEALLSIQEFSDDVPAPGTNLSVLIVKTTGPEGRPVVSFKRAKSQKFWDTIKAKFEKGEQIDGKINKRVKGGLNVDIGLDSFMPASQIDLRNVSNPETWVGQTVPVLVLEMDAATGNVLVSRRRILENERAVKREETLKTIKEGLVCKGHVKGLTKFGAFVDIGGIEGLLHISDMAWTRVEKPQAILKVGDEVEVKVLKYDATTHKISLGRKQLLPHPWDGIDQKFPLGSVVKGKVTNLASFGAFVSVAPAVEGLIHLSEFSWTDRIKKASDVLKVGQDVEVKVIEIDRPKEKLSLSLKRAGANPWEEAAKAHAKGSTLEGEVTNITNFGAFVRIPSGLEALIKNDDLSWVGKVQNAKQVFKVGQKVKAVVLDINVKQEKMALGLKQLEPDPMAKLRVGDAVEGTISKVTDFGVFVKLSSGLSGLIRSGELQLKKSIFSAANEAPKKQEKMDMSEFKVGESIKASVIKIIRKERKLDLSVRKFERKQEQNLLKKYSNQSGIPTLGEATGWDAFENNKNS